MCSDINISADVMKSLGAQTIIAVDVGSVYEPHQTNYGDSLSGWWLLWNKWNPFSSTVKVFTQSCRISTQIRGETNAVSLFFNVIYPKVLLTYFKIS